MSIKTALRQKTIRRRTAILTAFTAGLATSMFTCRTAARGLQPGEGTARIVVPFAAGGTTDIVAHVVAQILTESTGSTFVIDNKTGAGGDVSAEIVARAPPDGRTLLLGTVGTAVTNQYLHKYIPYDSVESFTPVALVGEMANLLVVHPSFPARTLKEFVDHCKALGPNKVSYGSPGLGSVGHLAMEYLQCQAGIKLGPVVHRGRTRMMKDLLAGEILVAMDNLPTYLKHIESGALRALAVSSAKRWFSAPDIPTVAEQGYGNFDATLWWYVAAPAGTRLGLVRKLSDAIVSGIKSEQMVGKIRKFGVLELPLCSEELVKRVAAEDAKWRNVITTARLEPQ
jgi:tripartite-type tricarboxylate transporter receptor subunit TctC